MGLIHGAYDAKAEGFAPGGLVAAQSDERPRPRRRKLAARRARPNSSRRRSTARWRSWSKPAGPTGRRNSRSTARSPIMTRPGPAFPRRSCRDRRNARSGARQLGRERAAAATFRSRTCRSASSPRPRAGAGPGVAIGDYILDLVGDRRPARRGLARGPGAAGAQCLAVARARGAARASRSGCPRLLSDERYRDDVEPQLIGQSEVRLHVPCLIGDYTDFYVGIHHATNVGKQFRPDNPLLPNYKYVPIGYHGRASSVRASGEPVIRPSGQRKAPDADAPEYGPSRRLDYELELGHLGRPRQRARVSRSRLARRASISPAIACSTTGRRATCRRGNISRSGRSSPRIS